MQGYPASLAVPMEWVPVGRSTMRVECLAQEQTQRPWPGLKNELLDCETSTHEATTAPISGPTYVYHLNAVIVC